MQIGLIDLRLLGLLRVDKRILGGGGANDDMSSGLKSK
jgi:hypothetical protein